MLDVVFRVLDERPGHLEARAEKLPLTITAPSLEELHHEAREALIQHLGPAHVAFRTRIHRRGARSAAVPIVQVLSCLPTTPAPAPLP